MNHPLVSVVVITYNQESLVTDSLESIAAQTYPNLELIVTDDCSPDQTLAVVEAWVAKNRQRFTRVEIVCASANRGITANARQGLAQVRGQFIKTISGDDFLEPNCIRDFLAIPHLDQKCIWAGDMRFIDAAGRRLDQREKVPLAKDIPLFSLSSAEQFYHLQNRNWIPLGGCFYSKALADEFQLFQEGLRFIDDWPGLLQATRRGCPVRYTGIAAAVYRVHPGGSWGNARFFRRILGRIMVLRSFAGLSWGQIAINILGKIREKMMRKLGSWRTFHFIREQ